MNQEDRKYIDEQIEALLRQKPDLVLSKEELKAQLDNRETLDDFIAYTKGLNHLTEDFDQLMKEISDKIKAFQKQLLYSLPLLVFIISKVIIYRKTPVVNNISVIASPIFWKVKPLPMRRQISQKSSIVTVN